MKRFLSVGLVFGFVFLGFLSGAQAEDKYPSRPIEMVVPFGPGGSADIAARCYSDDLAKILNVSINVVNRPGGTGIQGTTYVVKGKKDGYTLLGSTDTPLLVMPVLNKEVSYDPLKDVVPVGYFGSVPSVFAVRSDSPIKNLKDLVEYARKNPGKIKNGVAGIGTEANFNLEVILSQEKVKATSVPFGSGGKAAVALLGGHIDMSSNSLATLNQHLKSGKLRGIGICIKNRHPDFPDIPTALEQGYPEADFAVWTALFAPAGVPKQVLDVLVPAAEKAFKKPEVIERAVKVGWDVQYMGPEELHKHLASQIERVKKVAKEAGLEPK